MCKKKTMYVTMPHKVKRCSDYAGTGKPKPYKTQHKTEMKIAAHDFDYTGPKKTSGTPRAPKKKSVLKTRLSRRGVQKFLKF